MIDCHKHYSLRPVIARRQPSLQKIWQHGRRTVEAMLCIRAEFPIWSCLSVRPSVTTRYCGETA